MNDELLKGFIEIVSPEGVAGDVVSPADLPALALVASFCNEHGVPISATSGNRRHRREARPSAAGSSSASTD